MGIFCKLLREYYNKNMLKIQQGPVATAMAPINKAAVLAPINKVATTLAPINKAFSSIKQLKKQHFYKVKNGNFGVCFDIDGVLLRGKTLIPGAREAIEKLMNKEKTKFVVPTVFCTNGFGLKKVKADQLTEILQIKISANQLIMSQSPLESMTSLHNKVCLVSGPDHDGGCLQVAKNLGFKKIVTIDDVRKAFPYQDWVDRKRWPTNGQNVAPNVDFPNIEAIVLLGEPVRWETNLQLIIDVLVTNGCLSSKSMKRDEEHQLPVVAVNLDLQWMAKAATPRFGHGAFLLCLESLYKKITGKNLKYEALVGKPSVTTYEYAKDILEKQARKLNVKRLENIYMVGDNPLTDIYGANLFNRVLDEAPSTDDNHNVVTKQKCLSLLVCTGVYQPEQNGDDVTSSKSYEDDDVIIDHGHREFEFNKELTRADYITDDVRGAVDKICRIENWKSSA